MLMVRVLVSCIALVAACGAPPHPTNVEIDGDSRLAEPVSIGSLTVWPVVSDAAPDAGPILTLREASERGVARIRERGVPAEADRDHAVREALEETRVRALEFHDGEMTLEGAIRHLQSASGQSFVLSRGAAEERGNSQVVLRVTDVSVRQILDLLTEPMELTWGVRSGVVVISCQAEVERAVLDFYDVKDLCAPLPCDANVSSDAAPDPRPDAEDLIETIRATVEPASWARIEGADIQSKNNVLVVRTTPAVHAALARFLLDVRRGSQPPEGPAEVGTLMVENHGDLPILICAGTLLSGGKQNRQVGQDFLVKPRSTVPVDAFCVEPGRWEAGEDFTVEIAQAASIVRTRGQYECDQAAVWRETTEALRSASLLAPGTSDYHAVFDAGDEASRRRRQDSEWVVLGHIARIMDSGVRVVGIAYAIDGRPVSIRRFADGDLLRAHLEGLVRTACIEADLSKGNEGPRASAADATDLVRRIELAPEEVARTAAGNLNGLRQNEAGYGSACYLDEGRQVALVRDWTARAPRRSGPIPPEGR